MDQANQSLNQVKSTFASAKETVQDTIDVIGGFLATRESSTCSRSRRKRRAVGPKSDPRSRGWRDFRRNPRRRLLHQLRLPAFRPTWLWPSMARLGTIVATNPQKFAQLGIAIRDSSGQLLPMQTILRNTISGR